MTEQQHTPSPEASQDARQQALADIFGPKFVATFQSPVAYLDGVTLASPVSIRFFKKDFAYLSKQLYLEYQYRGWKGFSPDVLAKYQEITTRKLAAIKIHMNNTINRLSKLVEQNGVSLNTSIFPNAQTMTVPIIAAHARSYLDVLMDLDKVYLLAGTANLFGVIDSSQRAEAEFLCKKTVRAFRSVLQTEVIKLYREADRLIREQQGKGIVNAEMKAVVDEQGQAIADFESSSGQEDRHEVGMDLGGADPGQIIDSAAANSTALASEPKPKKTRSTGSATATVVAA